MPESQRWKAERIAETNEIGSFVVECDVVAKALEEAEKQCNSTNKVQLPTDNGKGKKKGICRDFPNCSRGQNCKFSHDRSGNVAVADPISERPPAANDGKGSNGDFVGDHRANQGKSNTNEKGIGGKRPKGERDCMQWLKTGECKREGCEYAHTPEKKNAGSKILYKATKEGRTCDYGDRCAFPHDKSKANRAGAGEGGARGQDNRTEDMQNPADMAADVGKRYAGKAAKGFTEMGGFRASGMKALQSKAQKVDDVWIIGSGANVVVIPDKDLSIVKHVYNATSALETAGGGQGLRTCVGEDASRNKVWYGMPRI